MNLRDDEKRNYFGRFINVDERFDWDASGNCIYKGYALPGTATSVEKFIVKKATYDTSNQITLIQTATWVSWDNRVTSF